MLYLHVVLGGGKNRNVFSAKLVLSTRVCEAGLIRDAPAKCWSHSWGGPKGP